MATFGDPLGPFDAAAADFVELVDAKRRFADDSGLRRADRAARREGDE
jgi:hypothetical protein